MQEPAHDHEHSHPHEESAEAHDHAYLHAHGIPHSHAHVHENQKAVLNRLSRLCESGNSAGSANQSSAKCKLFLKALANYAGAW